MGSWSRFTFPPMGVNPSQFTPPSAAPPRDGMTAETSITIQHHTCANCKKLRSRKYQSEHPLKPGEVPAAAFCRRCQRETTSTEQSEDTEGDSRKKKKKHRRNRSRITDRVSLTF
jgi:hypothetical protein